MELTSKGLEEIRELINKDIKELESVSTASERIRYISKLENLRDFVDAVKTEEDKRKLLENEVIQEYVSKLGYN